MPEATEPLLNPPATAMQRPDPVPALSVESLDAADGAQSSKVPVSQLIREDILLAGAYRTLAARTNALIDWVENEMKKQRARMQAKP